MSTNLSLLHKLQTRKLMNATKTIGKFFTLSTCLSCINMAKQWKGFGSTNSNNNILQNALEWSLDLMPAAKQTRRPTIIKITVWQLKQRTKLCPDAMCLCWQRCQSHVTTKKASENKHQSFSMTNNYHLCFLQHRFIKSDDELPNNMLNFWWWCDFTRDSVHESESCPKF